MCSHQYVAAHVYVGIVRDGINVEFSILSANAFFDI